MTPDHIILHHSLTKDGKEVNYNAIKRYHVETLGWRDIGYHVIIEDQRGEVNALFGRMLNESGAHTKQRGMNNRSIGICMVGNFDIAEPSPQIWNLALRLCRSFMDIYGIANEKVQGHREYASYKSCPGNLFDLGKFRYFLKHGDNK